MTFQNKITLIQINAARVAEIAAILLNISAGELGTPSLPCV